PKSSRELNFKILTPNDFHVLDIKSKDEFGSYDFDVDIEYQHLDNSYKSLFKLEKYWDNYINEDHPNTVKYDPQKNIINMSWEVPGPSYLRRVPGRISGPATINYDIKNKEIISTKWALGPTDS